MVEPLLPFLFWRNYGVRDLMNCEAKFEVFFNNVLLVECLQTILRVDQNKMDITTNAKERDAKASDICLCRTQNKKK